MGSHCRHRLGAPSPNLSAAPPAIQWLHHLLNPPATWWRGEDSNLRRHKPADLQSAPVGRFGTSPFLTHHRWNKKRREIPHSAGQNHHEKMVHANSRVRSLLFVRRVHPIPSGRPSGVELTCASLVSVLIPATPKNPAAIPAGADDGTRTRNLLITNQLLYQLSYVS